MSNMIIWVLIFTARPKFECQNTSEIQSSNSYITIFVCKKSLCYVSVKKNILQQQRNYQSLYKLTCH